MATGTAVLARSGEPGPRKGSKSDRIVEPDASSDSRFCDFSGSDESARGSEHGPVGALTDDMARMAMAVGQRYVGARKWRKIRRVVKEDAFSGALVKLVRLWPRTNDRNPFAYLTAMVRSATIDEVRKKEARARLTTRVEEVVRRAGEDAA